MNRILASTMLLASICLASVSRAPAQGSMQATIPFGFTVGQKALPPGNYSITYVEPRVIELANWEKHASAFISMTADDFIAQRPYELVFNKYGDRLFLSEVRGGLGGVALGATPSKTEKEIRNQTAQHSLHRTEIAMK
jgi:hypothetical protein